ncbi:hypothetical protein D6817_01845 [Candidatus Pacearchaeota archaeon]|nr:MAG: hypothetical protein D6817_01845 [Candidatus Pacearchaeota archaeon]
MKVDWLAALTGVVFIFAGLALLSIVIATNLPGTKTSSLVLALALIGIGIAIVATLREQEEVEPIRDKLKNSKSQRKA